jgi:hypothetical protein
VAFDIVFGVFAVAILLVSFLIVRSAVRRSRQARDRSD